ncbi:HU family DNA-binding protein [Gemmobacter sp. 24YEA27]|uniref:HU family DNA-binding protein n=1 Tax=Gemmobacter sp. 24YEA27 TaxID=3040672 RepID=UPI0024B34621|nr:HU family DNA-binding protein [Gemmobacter sp. 24YEA27]
MPALKTAVKPKVTPARKAPPAKAAEVPASPAGKAGEEARVKSAGLKLKDLLVRVAEQSDAPKKTQREVSEAVLAVLGTALAAGEELNLPGLGRLKVVKSSDKSGGAVLTVKVKNAGQKKEASGKEPLAEDGEDS